MITTLLSAAFITLISIFICPIKSQNFQNSHLLYFPTSDAIFTTNQIDPSNYDSSLPNNLVSGDFSENEDAFSDPGLSQYSGPIFENLKLHKASQDSLIQPPNQLRLIIVNGVYSLYLDSDQSQIKVTIESRKEFNATEIEKLNRITFDNEISKNISKIIAAEAVREVMSETNEKTAKIINYLESLQNQTLITDQNRNDIKLNHPLNVNQASLGNDLRIDGNLTRENENENLLNNRHSDLFGSVLKLKTSAVNLLPLYQYKEGKQIIIGYQSSISLLIIIKQQFTGEILSNLIEFGINRIDSISFSVNAEKMKNSRYFVISKAIDDARKQAESIIKSSKSESKSKLKLHSVRTIGLTNPGPLNEQIEFNQPQTTIGFQKSRMISGDQIQSVPLVAGQSVVTANIQTTFSF